MLAILTAIQSNLNMEAKSERHRTVSRSLQTITSSLDVNLAKPYSKRDDVDVFMMKITQQMTDISDVAPMIPYSVLQKFPDLVDAEYRGTATTVTSVSNGKDITALQENIQSISCRFDDNRGSNFSGVDLEQPPSLRKVIVKSSSNNVEDIISGEGGSYRQTRKYKMKNAFNRSKVPHPVDRGVFHGTEMAEIVERESNVSDGIV